jgi:rubrerythrin
MADKVSIVIHDPVVHEPLPVASWVAAFYMACRACGKTMRRGTQCPSCGAWCR